MPSRITIEKFSAAHAEYWTNVYWHPGSVAEALAAAADIVIAERNVTGTFVTFTKYRADDGIRDTEQFMTVTVNAPGLLAQAGEGYPLFAVARVDFTVSGGGRPSRKFLRGVLDESKANGLTVSADILAALNSYAAAVCAAGCCDVDGQDFVSGAAFPQVAMRQLRRGSKKSSPPSRVRWLG